MNAKIKAAASILGAALVITAGVGYQQITANAGTVETMVEDPDSELTGQEAAAFGTCAQSIWIEVVVANIVEFVLWRSPQQESGEPRPVLAYVIERVTTHEDVYAALDIAGGVWSENAPGCAIAVDGTDVSYCIKRGALELDATQIACLKTATQNVIGSVKGVEFAHLRAGPPRTLETSHEEDKSPHDYAACRAAGTCRRTR